MTVDLVRIRGVRHYVAADEKGVATLGPVHHGRPGMFERMFMGSEDQTVVIPAQKAATALMPAVPPIFPPVVPGTVPVPPELPPAPPPQERRTSRWARLKDAFMVRATDDDWHHVARQCAGTALLWGFTVFSFCVFARGLWWLTSL